MKCPEGKIYNPKTKRCINDTPANRQKIGFKSKSKSKSPQILIRRDPPPMGPLIHPDFIKTYEISIDKKKKKKQLKKNYIEFYTYLFNNRITKIINKEVPLSLMEKNDLLELSKIVTHELEMISVVDEEDIKAIHVMENQLKEVFKNNEVIDDQPTKKNIGGLVIEPLRYKNRLQIIGLYNLIRGERFQMKESLKLKDFSDLITSSVISRLVSYKLYIDELIRLGVFSHDDLYKNMFESEYIFDELIKLHADYMEAYKKTKKNNSA